MPRPLLLLLLTFIPFAAMAQGPLTCFETDPNTDPDIAIPACSAAIASGTLEGAWLAEAHATRGIAHRELGQLNQSKDDLETAIRIDPAAPHMRMLAWTYRTMRRQEEAEAIYTQILETDDHWQSWLSRCVVRQDLEKFEQAVGDCEQAVLRDPDNTDALYFAARAHNILGQGHRALPLARKATSLDPEKTRHLVELAWAMHLTGDTSGGRELVRDRLAETPGDPELLDYLRQTDRP
ncbi:MAG: hypothetical protein RLO10_03975 [Roseovarius indicus]